MGKRAQVCQMILLPVVLASVLATGGAARAQTYRTVSWGDSGGDVCDAQAALQRWGDYSGIVDCVFGPITSGAVQDFQARNGLTVDGIIGTGTWAALGYTVAPYSAAPTAAPAAAGDAGRSQDVDLVARVIRAEAESEPYEGKVAVAAVLLNRVRDSRFPNTLQGVIYQPDAFESVSNGRIYNTPPTAEDVQAARDASNGWDPSYGAVFFWNPSKPVSPWIWSRTIITQIGGHAFAR